MSKHEMAAAMLNGQPTKAATTTGHRLGKWILLGAALLIVGICCTNQTCYDPHVSCRIGEASNPGPLAPEEPPEGFVDASDDDDDEADDAPFLAESSSNEEMAEQNYSDDSSSDEEMDDQTDFVSSAPEHRAVISELLKGARRAGPEDQDKGHCSPNA